MINKLISCFLVCSVVMFSCKSRKAAVIGPEPVQPGEAGASRRQADELTLKSIDASANTFGFYQARAKAAYRDDAQSVDFDISIMMEKDRYIWMSVTALLGIEVARVMITPDSVKILDRLHRRCIITDFGYIQRMSNVPLKLENLQNIIVGNTVFPNSVQKSEVDTVLNVLAVYTRLATQRQNTFYNPQFRPQRTTVAENNQSREMKIVYNAFSVFGQNTFPSSIDINIRAEKNLQCTFELGNFVFEKKRDAQFSVPSSYEVVRP